MNKKLVLIALLFTTAALSLSDETLAAMADHKQLPPAQYTDVDPNVMVNLSIETPMGGAAYNDQDDTALGGTCSGRITRGGGEVGACYTPTKVYLGYFDPNKCYTYQNGLGRYEPAGSTNANHECTGEFSGNFLNWATMTAIDMFTWTMTGGNRVVDTTSSTVIERKRKQNNNSWFPYKYLSNADNVAPSTVTPWADAEIYIYNTDFGVQFGTTRGGSEKATHNVRMVVCDSSAGLEANCKAYGSSYKPEGLIQRNSYRMRFSVMSYLKDDSQSRHGGVLRANMKYVGPYRPAADGGIEANPDAEWSATTGIFTVNPDATQSAKAANVYAASGVINYINKFAQANGYKSYDPIGELFYECINYFKNRGPTPEYYAGLDATKTEGFPVFTTWDDPITNSCQKNYIIGINDANPWLDKKLPGNAVTTSTTYYASGWAGSDWGTPGNADPAINVVTLTNKVGDLQGITGTNRNVGCVPGNCNMSCTSKTIAELGKAYGTCPYSPKQNSYYIAGLAYYANAYDIRSDIANRQTVTTFMIDTQEYGTNPLVGEMNMLWLAGKFGGFKEQDYLDTNADGNAYEPNLAAEWDADGDGQPDNYVLATQPEKLVAGLNQAFSSISNRVSAGSSTAVIANSASATGAVIQAIYQPKVNNTSTGQQVQWVGTMHAIFIDDQSKLREDGNQNGQLDDYATDRVIEMFYDAAAGRTKVRRFTTADGITLIPYDVIEIDELKTIWNARDSLADLNNASISTQRNYSTAINATNGRHIFTWIDSNADGVVDAGETQSFTSSAMSSNYRYLNVADSTSAENIVNFVRGQEGIAGFRSRQIDYDNDGYDEVWRLGDIVHSSPYVVGPPSANYDSRIGDITYTAFRTQYANRRQVAYVGANDGMLHAFNAGFFDPNNKAFILKNTSGTETQHPLGAELWSYVPMNLLPHLQWLKELDYPHVYYVDGPVRAYDVNIFTPDATHPNGWGTILVVGMRLGGNTVAVDTNGDGTNDWTSRSAYMILDVTDPESPPTLLAEITDPNLGFTTSLPTVSVQRVPGDGQDWFSPTQNEWYLVFGSGPTDLATATSNQTARLYIYDLKTNNFISNFAPKDLGIANSFVGNVISQDWHRDFYDDSIYFGIAGNTINAPDGRLMQVVVASSMDSSAANTLLNPGKPVVGAPTTGIDEQGNWWVYFGTGRFFVREDNLSATQQAFYGVKDPLRSGTASTISLSSLVETTNIRIFSDRSLIDVDGVLSPALPANTFDQLVQRVAANSGWFFKLPGGSPSTRMFTNPVFLRSLLLFTTYSPPADICVPEGSSSLYSVYYKTGTAYPDSGLGNDTSITNGTGVYMTMSSISFGTGLASDVVVYQSPKKRKATTIVNLGTGELRLEDIDVPVLQSTRQSWREIHLD